MTANQFVFALVAVWLVRQSVPYARWWWGLACRWWRGRRVINVTSMGDT